MESNPAWKKESIAHFSVFLPIFFGYTANILGLKGVELTFLRNQIMQLSN